jgi:hypothetical protein
MAPGNSDLSIGGWDMKWPRENEEEMSVAFSGMISRGGSISCFPPFAHVIPEMALIQGIADFVACPDDLTGLDYMLLEKLVKSLTMPSRARVLSLLKRRAVRTEGYLLRYSGYSLPVLRRTLDALKQQDVVEEPSFNRYVLSESFPETLLDLWAFEIKVERWQRALFQALQYKSFATHVVVVLSHRHIHRTERHFATFDRFGIGLLSLDLNAGSIQVMVRPRRAEPSSLYQRLCAMGRFLQAFSPQLSPFTPT